MHTELIDPSVIEGAPPRGQPRESIGLAFLGCGAITSTHSRTIQRLDPSIARFYASRNPARAIDFARQFSGRAGYRSYEAALRSPEVDVVLIATPPSTHLGLTLAALERGKDVIVEKPAFLTAGDAERVEELAARTGGRVLVAENYCYKPLTGFLRRIVESGELGDILFVQVNATKQQASGGWRTEQSIAGGGALFEGGVHWIHLMANLGLEVDSVDAIEAGPRRSPERSSLMVFRYRNGAVGTLQHSWETPSLLRGLRLSKIAGTRGSITFESNGVAAVVRGRGTRLRFPGLTDIRGYRAMFADFIQALYHGTPTRMTLAMARSDLALLEAGRR